MARPTPDDVVELNRAATVARLLAGVAHEVNNALLVIAGTAELVEDRPEAEDAVVKSMARIRAQTARAAGSIAQVLHFARGDPASRSRVNLREIGATSIALRAYAISRAGSTIALEPADDRRVIVHGSPVLLQQVALNFIANAEQALSGRKGGRIRVEVTESEGAAMLRVLDSGPGIDPDIRHGIFDAFVSGTGRPDAPGLGLPAARRIAEIHGGTVEVVDRTDGGEVVLTLPLA